MADRHCRFIWRGYRLTCIMLALLLGIFAPACAAAAQSAPSVRTVRVAVFPLGNFQYFDSNGNACGYNIEFLDKLSLTTHWRYEYVAAENFQDACRLLSADEVDIVAPVQTREYLAEQFVYSAYTMATESAAIFVLDNSYSRYILYEDFDAMAQMDFGMVKPGASGFTQSFLEDYSAKNHFIPKSITYYDNMTEVFAAMNKGEIDAAVTNILFNSDEYKMLARFSPVTSYYIMQPENDGLKDELDEAMANLLMNDPGYQTSLMSSYFKFYTITSFTYEEEQYIKQLPVIRVGYQVNHPPLSYTDENGEFAGISRRLMDEISANTGIEFEYAALPATDVTYQYLRENGINVLCNVEYNEVNLATPTMSLSSPYLESEKVIVAPDGVTLNSRSIMTMALASGSQSLQQVILAEYPQLKFKLYATLEEAFDAVKDGEADVLMDNRYTVERLLAKPRYSGLNVIPVQSLADDMCVATIIYKDVDSEINSLLDDSRFISSIDKGIKLITDPERTNIIIDETSRNRYTYSLMDFCYQYRYPLIACAALLVVCAVLLICMRRAEVNRNRQMAEKNRQLGKAIENVERANQSKASFLARMSDEIRNPANAIMGEITLAEKYMNDEARMREHLDKVKRSARHMLDMVDDVLTLSPVEKSSEKAEKPEFELRRLVNSAKQVCNAECGAKGVTFRIDQDGIRHGKFKGDYEKLNRCMENLLKNSLHFTGRGGDITLGIAEEDGGGNVSRLRITVSDSGCGMSEEALRGIFRPFTPDDNGTGVCATKNMVESMGGYMTAESREGVGTTFVIDVPLEYV